MADSKPEDKMSELKEPKDQKEPKEPKEQRDLNPARRPQRLYLRRERAAMPKAMTLLQTTPWVYMSEEDKKTIVLVSPQCCGENR